MPGDSEALAAAKGLTEALEGMTRQLAALAAYGKRNRHMIWGLIVSIALDLVLTVVVAVFAIQAHDANTSAQAARVVAAAAKQNNLALCEAGNVARAQQIGLWNHLLSLPPAPGSPRRSAGQEQQITAFRAYIAGIFKPRDCAALGKNGH